MSVSSKQLAEWGFAVPDGDTVARRIPPAVVKPTEKRPAIRIPGAPLPNKTERRFEQYALARWAPCWLSYEPMTLRLPSGTRYTPDWFMCVKDAFYVVEVKGPHIHNSRSLHAWKEAKVAFPYWRFVFAQWSGGEWLLAGDLPDF